MEMNPSWNKGFIGLVSEEEVKMMKMKKAVGPDEVPVKM
jgi:hypothetical protein